MSVSYQKVICARSWGHIEAFGDLRSAKNKLTATLFLIHNQKNHPVVIDVAVAHVNFVASIVASNVVSNVVSNGVNICFDKLSSPQS